MPEPRKRKTPIKGPIGDVLVPKAPVQRKKTSSISETNQIAHSTPAVVNTIPEQQSVEINVGAMRITPLTQRVAPRSAFPRRFLSMLAVLAVVLGGYGIYRSNKSTIEVGHVFSREQEDLYIKAVSEKMVVPSERPKIFVITQDDINRNDEEFFTQGLAGDVVLIYEGEGKAILWSPSRNIVVNAGPVIKNKTAIQ